MASQRAGRSPLSAVDTSVIVPMLNSESTVAEAITSIIGQQYPDPWELIVVDNGSTDASVAVVQKLLEQRSNDSLTRTSVERCTDRRGHATPRNFGAELASGEVLVFADADDVCGPGWLRSIVAETRVSGLAASHHVSIGARVEGGDPSEDTGVRKSAGRKLGYPVATTAGMGVMRSLFDQLHGFDVRFDSGGADADFSIRAAKTASVTPTVSPDALYYFRQGKGFRPGLSRGYRYGRSQARLAAHHGLEDDRSSTNWFVLARLLAGLVRRLPHMLSPRLRAGTATHIGFVVGRSLWSIRLMRRPF